MFGFFERIFSKGVGVPRRPHLGVDIGTVSVKAVEMDMRSGKPAVTNYGLIETGDYLERTNSVLQTSSLSIAEGEAVAVLKALISQMGTRIKDVVATVPAFSSFTSIIDMPVMNEEETAKAVPYQARSLVPLPMSDVTIDWIPIGQFEGREGEKKQRIFLVSVPNEQIRAHKAVFKKAGLNLKMLEVESLSLARSLTTGSQENVLIIDIGAFSRTVVIAGQGLLKYSNQTDFAGNSMTQALTKGLGISVRRAEALKRQRGLSGMAGEYGLSTLMIPFLDVILNEGRKAKEVFEGGGNKVSKIIFSGGGGMMQGIAEYASKQFDLPAEKADPFSLVAYAPEIAPLLKSEGSRLSVATGVGMKLFI